MTRFLYLLGCAVRLLAAGLTRNWDAYDNTCADIEAAHEEKT
jgi:hypothetical protein